MNMNMTTKNSGSEGFTLIELLIVIGIIGFLAAAVLIAVDPVKRIQDSRDARRSSETNAVLNAILTKQVDDRSLFGGLGSAPIVTDSANSQVIVIGDSGVACDTPANAPACPAVTLSTAAGKGCVANLGGLLSGTATSSGATVTGASTAFTTEVSVGDTLVSASGGTCSVTVVGSNTSITCGGAPSPAFSGTVTNTTKSIVPSYIASIPIDPRGSGAIPTPGNLALGNTNTGYYIHRTNGNRVEIGSCYPEQASAISVKR
ncbi:MAG: hypothetical protein RL272_243 [Candidatus Parcubacteria bacterium]